MMTVNKNGHFSDPKDSLTTPTKNQGFSPHTSAYWRLDDQNRNLQCHSLQSTSMDIRPPVVATCDLRLDRQVLEGVYGEGVVDRRVKVREENKSALRICVINPLHRRFSVEWVVRRLRFPVLQRLKGRYGLG